MFNESDIYGTLEVHFAVHLSLPDTRIGSGDYIYNSWIHFHRQAITCFLISYF